MQQCTKQEQRSVVRFFFSEDVKLFEIHRRMSIQYGDRCMSRTQVYEWTENFKNGVNSVEDSPRPRQAFTAVTENNIAAVENVVWEKRRVAVKEVSSLLDISVGSAHHIIHDELKFRKVCARWVPKRLTPEMKERRAMLAKSFCVGMRLMVKHFCSVSSLGMRVWYTSTSQKESDKAWSGATPCPQNRRSCGRNDLQANSC